MLKVMIFIDGTWLYHNRNSLAQSYGSPDYQLDFGALPKVLAGEVGKFLSAPQMDVVRTYLFASYASNYDLADEDSVQRRLDFFSMLKEEYHYEVELFPIDFRGRRLRKTDRGFDDPFEPKEKCVDIALATTMLYYAAMANAYDIALAVIGDRDYMPVLHCVRRLGKRVAIASIKSSHAREFADPCDEARIRDFDTIWIDDLLGQLELKYERKLYQCQSPIHKGDKNFWTSFRPRKGERIYCDECRQEFQRQKHQAQREYVSSQPDEYNTDSEYDDVSYESTQTGIVTNKNDERGFGFIQTRDGEDYFFHFTEVRGDLDFADIQRGDTVQFDIKRYPSNDKAGAAQNVRPI